MHAILASIGTDGDVVPYIGLGARLRARGHRVTLAANEPFRTLAAEHGFGFRALVTAQETDALFGNPDFWNPVKGAWIAARWGVGMIDRQYGVLAELAADEDAVLAAVPALFAARLVHEKLSRPLASVVLQPWMIPSTTAPPVMPGGLTLPRGMPRPAGALYWRMIDLAGEALVGGRLNRLRRSLGLKKVRRVFRWWYSPQRILGLFPEWYGRPQADWPRQTRLTGFPLYDGRPGAALPREVGQFCQAGPPPVAFTFGTGMMHAGRFFRAALAACRELGVRALFLTRYGRQLPSPLPPSVRACSFAPFQELFPLCMAVVHHGGVGTTARALAAGIPQLVLPLAYDQFDNAARVKQLGAGNWLRPGRRKGRHVARALSELLSLEVRTRCQAVATQFRVSDGLDAAAQILEDVARQR